jgi:hypothetical protein
LLGAQSRLLRARRGECVQTVANMVLVLTAALVAHLIEEVSAGFRTRFPLGPMPKPIFIGVNIVIYTYCGATLILATRGHPMAIHLSWILASVMLLNGLGHLGIMITRRDYFPGGFTAIFVLVASLLLMAALAGT